MSIPSVPWLPPFSPFSPEHPYDTCGHAHEDVWAGRWIDMGMDV
jgi:hypothetical protein